MMDNILKKLIGENTKFPKLLNNYQSKNDNPVNDPVKLSLLQTDLLEQISLNAEITSSQLCESLNVSLATIRRIIAQLKELVLIERKRSDKVGHWIINEMKGAKS